MNALAIILVKGQADAFRVCTNVRPTRSLSLYIIYITSISPFEKKTHTYKQAAVPYFHDCPEADQRFLGLKEAKTWAMLGLIAITLLISMALPKLGCLGRVVPASLVAIVGGTAIEWGLYRKALGIETRTVGDTAALGDGLPGFHWPVLPHSPAWGTIFAYAVSLCLIGGACVRACVVCRRSYM
jgi:hypothetical protein